MSFYSSLVAFEPWLKISYVFVDGPSYCGQASLPSLLGSIYHGDPQRTHGFLRARRVHSEGVGRLRAYLKRINTSEFLRLLYNSASKIAEIQMYASS